MPKSFPEENSSTPKRQSIAERLADLQAQRQESLEQLKGTQFSNPPAEFHQTTETDAETVTSTALHAGLFGDQFYSEPVLTVTQAGDLQAADVVAAAELFQVRWEDAQPFASSLAADNHLLLLTTEVDPRELEALAVSIWEQARWLAPGELFLFEGARLRGPFEIQTTDAKQLNINPEFAQVWVLEVAPERSRVSKVLIGNPSVWADSFGNMQPAGAELGALNAVLRMAKRLAGAVRVASNANPEKPQTPITPDPDSAVNLRVFAPRWLDNTDLSTLLKGYFPDLKSVTEQVDEALETQIFTAREELELAKVIPENELQTIAEVTESADAKVLQGTIDYLAYLMRASVGNRSAVEISVAKVKQHLPVAVRHQAWSTGSVVEYCITWLPDNQNPYSSFDMQVNVDNPLGMTRSLRLERSRASAEIEQIAILLAKTCSGVILDEDGFLIAD
ncbi:hypothetical protein NXS08_04355 [Gleimia sp. 6138-11-ORH1]|uniref:hypothetical protein n=1 Tax=Gleimia sp. 6138-11-ORH1 TaxID=2973937 RepID=UPI00216900A6|nr:hypothetical protein [Gleimia sp. 6138-11-ORH1]MCS4484714.1 hypothetical protein [Gleimia sp. 6138-11-ORH1]